MKGLQSILSRVISREIRKAIGAAAKGNTAPLEELIGRAEQAMMKSGNVVDAAKAVLDYLVVAAIGAVYQLGGSFVSSHSLIILAAVLAYVVLPDPIPGPFDDAALLFLASQYLDATNDFAKWIVQQNTPPPIPALVILPRKRRRSAETWLWETARKHATKLLQENVDLKTAISSRLKQNVTASAPQVSGVE